MKKNVGQLAFIATLSIVPMFVLYDIATRFAERGVHTGSAENNAAMYPRLIAVLMAGLLILQFARTAFSTTQGKDLSRFHPASFLKTHVRAIAVFGLFLIYLWAFRWFGFVYGTPVFLALVQAVLGVRNPLKIGLYATGVTTVIYLAFSKLLHLALPAGDIFG